MNAITNVIQGPAKAPENASDLPTACVICSHNCGVRIDVKDNEIVKIRGDENHPSTKGYICNKAYAIPNYIKHKLRVEHPLKKRPDGSFERISWDQAISEIAAKLNHIRHTHAPRAIALAGIGGQGNHSNTFGAIPFMYSVGSPSFFNALSQEKTQHAMNDRRLFRSTPDLYLPGDEHYSDYAIFIGTNPLVSNRGINATDSIKEIGKNPDRKMVVVDPRITETSRRADRHLRVRPTRDVYLLLALAGILVQEDRVNRNFLHNKTRGYPEVASLLRRVDVTEMASRCGVSLEDLQATAREFAAAKTACISYDLGIEQIPHSTIISYLIRIILLMTGNLGRRGGNIFVQTYGPNMPFISSSPRALVSGLEAIPMFVPLSQFSPNLIPEEILNDHPERIRALIVDGANPLASYADSSRFREAFAKLDLLVVIEPAMTETARTADYVLPTPTGYEKWELSTFPKDMIVPQLRPPVVNGPAEALPEVEIYFRLARAMGLIAPAPKYLHRLAKKARTPLGSPAYLAVLIALSAVRGGGSLPIAGRAVFWAYETLGPLLPNPMLSNIWLMTLGYALTRRDQIDRALPELRTIKNPFVVVERIFNKLLAHPEGVVVGHLDLNTNFDTYCGYRDGKARMFQADFARDIEALLRNNAEANDREYPFILNSGLRTGWSANSLIRDPGWRKGKGPHAALHIHAEDAAALGVENGAQVKLSSRRGSVTVAVKIDAATLPGHVHLPNIFDLKYPDPETGELRSTGVTINELSDATDRDPYTGCPNLKRIRCRIDPSDVRKAEQ
ncbi:MAG TPA: molybdopterin-dependent oxidoreductase [Dongiaceae bacterium]|nr:molybdopterin-dependent oxidoreductase [Dongiaceae bacterium]